ncbi:MAG TPA: hypothetical protein VHO25_15465 [Polyangiaceae bacterium]|nr:hypothetical protein [Polyangiaceae bacterium]
MRNKTLIGPRAARVAFTPGAADVTLADAEPVVDAEVRVGTVVLTEPAGVGARVELP